MIIPEKRNRKYAMAAENKTITLETISLGVYTYKQLGLEVKNLYAVPVTRFLISLVEPLLFSEDEKKELNSVISRGVTFYFESERIPFHRDPQRYSTEPLILPLGVISPPTWQFFYSTGFDGECIEKTTIEAKHGISLRDIMSTLVEKLSDPVNEEFLREAIPEDPSYERCVEMLKRVEESKKANSEGKQTTITDMDFLADRKEFLLYIDVQKLAIFLNFWPCETECFLYKEPYDKVGNIPVTLLRQV